jgi:outer membrane receptor protein involved in Fe transport
VTFVGLWTRDDAAALTNPGLLSVHEHADADTGEGGAYLTGGRFNVVAGGSVFSGSDQLRPILSGRTALPITTAQADDHSVWLYSNLTVVPALRLTLGGNFDQQRAVVDRSQFSPKLGASWDILSGTTLRAAWFTNLKRPLIGDPSFRGGQTIEPTQIAGFDQFFDDLLGTKARRWGVGIDRKFSNPFFTSDTLLMGAEWSQRQLVVPISSTAPTGMTTISEPGWKERYGRAYLGWLLGERLALDAAVDYEAIDRTLLAANLDGFTNIQLVQAPLTLRYFDPNGILGLVRATVVREQGQFFNVTTGNVAPGRGTFATMDIGIGWRYPGRPLIATFEAQNLLDSHFHYQDTDPLNPRIFPRRTFLGRITIRL